MEAPFSLTASTCDLSLAFGATLPPERRRLPALSLFFIMVSLITIRPATVAKLSRDTCEEIQAFQGVQDTGALPGKLFFYPISSFAFYGTITHYKVTLANGSVLPKWLEYNPNTSTLQGLPMLEESGVYHLTVAAHGKACGPNISAAAANFTLHVHNCITICEKQISINQNPVNDIICSEGLCARAISVTFAEIIIYHTTSYLTIQERFSLIYTMADYLHLDPSFLTLTPFKESFNKHLWNLTVLSEEIKYISPVENHYVGLSWPAGFGVFAMLYELVQVLRHNVQSSHLTQLLGYEIAGWRILWKGSNEKKHVGKRHRRQLMATPRPTLRPTKLGVKPTKMEASTFWSTTLLHTKPAVRPSAGSLSLYEDSGTAAPSYTDISFHSVTSQRDLGTLHVLSVHTRPPAFTIFQSLSSAVPELSPSLMTASLTGFERQDNLSSRTPPISELLQSQVQHQVKHSTPQKSEPKPHFTKHYFSMPASKIQASRPVQPTVSVSVSPEDAPSEKMPGAHFPKELVTSSAYSSPYTYLAASGLVYEGPLFTTSLPVLATMSSLAKLKFPFSSAATFLFFSGCSQQKQDLFSKSRYDSESFMTSPQMKEHLFREEKSPHLIAVLTETSRWAADLNLMHVTSTADSATTGSPLAHKLGLTPDTRPVPQLYYTEKTPALTTYSTALTETSRWTMDLKLMDVTSTAASATIGSPSAHGLAPDTHSVPQLDYSEKTPALTTHSTALTETSRWTMDLNLMDVTSTAASATIGSPSAHGLAPDTHSVPQLDYSEKTPALTTHSTVLTETSRWTMDINLMDVTSTADSAITGSPFAHKLELTLDTSPVPQLYYTEKTPALTTYSTVLAETSRWTMDINLMDATSTAASATIGSPSAHRLAPDTRQVPQIHDSEKTLALTTYSTEEPGVSLFPSLVEFGVLPRTSSIPTELPSQPLSSSIELADSLGFHNISQVEELLSDNSHISQIVFKTDQHTSEPFMTVLQTSRLLFLKDKASTLTKMHVETSVWVEPSRLIYITTSGVVVLGSQFLSVDSLSQGTSQTHLWYSYDPLLLSLPVELSGTPELHFSKYYFSSYSSGGVRIPVAGPDVLQLETSDLILASTLGTKGAFHITRKFTSPLLKDSTVTSLQTGLHATSVFPGVQVLDASFPSLHAGASIFPLTPSEESFCGTGTIQTPWLSTSQVITTGQTNTFPRVVNAIRWITATIGHKFSFSVPPDTFYDQEDGDTPQLTLGMNPADGSPMGSGNWLHFNSRFQTMYGYPLANDFQYSPQEFLLFATDSEGLKTSDTFTIELFRPTTIPCHNYTIRTKNSYHSFLRERERVDLFFEKLSKYLSSGSPGNMTLLCLRPGSTLITWYDHSFCARNNRCARDEIQGVLVKLRLPGGNVHPDFVEAMLPEYNIYHTEDVAYGGTCSSNESFTTNRTIAALNNCHSWTKNILFALLISICAAIMIILMTFWYCKYNKEIIGSQSTSFHVRPFFSYADLKMDVLKSRKPAIVEQEVLRPPELWLPVPIPSQQHLCRPSANPAASRLPAPPKYRLPPLYGMDEPSQTSDGHLKSNSKARLY